MLFCCKPNYYSLQQQAPVAAPPPPPSFATVLDYTIDPHHQQQICSEDQNDDRLMVNYMLMNTSSSTNNIINPPPHHHHHQQQQQISSGLMSFADVMQFADFGPKLALNQTKIAEQEEDEEDDQSGNNMVDPVYFLKFPVLNDKSNNMEEDHQSLVVPQPGGDDDVVVCRDHHQHRQEIRLKDKAIMREDHEEAASAARVSGNNSFNNTNNTSVQQLQFLGEDLHKNPTSEPNKNKRKRPRTIKTSEEVESQRMTHIAVERNRRKQMNEHLRVLRSLMPGSYVQRGDQASIIGGAIEFVRELEQLLQCLESQKRRRLLGEAPRQVGADPTSGGGGGGSGSGSGVGVPMQPPHHLAAAFFPPNLPLGSPNEQLKFVEFETGGGLREETAENKSCLADVEVKLLGFDAMIKILSRRRPGQLIKTIAALEDLQFNILHTNITTIEQTVLYSFNVKVTSESRFSAEDIASSVQQIFNFIHANSSI